MVRPKAPRKMLVLDSAVDMRTVRTTTFGRGPFACRYVAYYYTYIPTRRVMIVAFDQTLIINLWPFHYFSPQPQPDRVLDGRRPFDADVPDPVGRRRDRVPGLSTRPGLTGTVHRTPSRRDTDVVPADDQQLGDHQHDDVHAGTPAVVRRRPSAHGRAQFDGQAVLAAAKRVAADCSPRGT